MNHASIFTLEKDAKGYKDFEDFPENIYVDTSAWVCAYGSSNQSAPIANKGKRRGGDITEFIKDCVDQGVVLYHSNLILKEAIHVNMQAYLDYVADKNHDIKIPYYDNGKTNYKKLHELIAKKYPSINKDIKRSQDDFLNFIKNASILLEYTEDEESMNDVLNVIDSTSGLMDSQDASHVCIARSYGINSFLTADADFIYLDNDNIFTVSNERYLKEKIGRSNILLPFDENKY